ncbi:MAG: DUF4154 domain-containing protein [Bacteroidetes bacterium]|nr:DUF4154 domain-containing protein [Bacteroidota bacterium]
MRFKLPYILLFCFFFQSAQAQLDINTVKTTYVLNMAKFIEWENENDITEYRIGVFGANEIYEELSKREEAILFKNKPFEVIQFRKIRDIHQVHILYVDKKRNHLANKILQIATDNNILMFTDSCMNHASVMINLLDIQNPGEQFDINKENINNAGLFIPPKLLFYGGSAEDLRDLYQNLESQLSNVQKNLEKQTAELERQQEALETKKEEIRALYEEINLQKENLNDLTSELQTKQDSLAAKITLLDAQQIKIRNQQADIDKQYEQLNQQEVEIENRKKFLENQQSAIENQQQEIEDQTRTIQGQQLEIKDQTNTLNNQNIEIQDQSMKIEKQQTMLYVFFGFFILIAGMVFFILRAYKIKREANRKLAEKNAAINKQKEEIQAHREKLQQTNQKIERQNENIKSSIRYALTIQQALLPLKKDIDEVYESFIIYRPKDIVSGDFYWLSKVDPVPESGSKGKIFLAVVDCTGHGVPGAFLSTIGIKLLNSVLNERKEYQPNKILEMLNFEVQKALKQEETENDDGMDVCLVCLEKCNDQKTKLTFSGAKRPLYYVRGQELKINTLRGDRKAVGGRFFKDQRFTNKELLLEQGDRVFLTTDGMIDQNAPNRKKFGSKRFVNLLQESIHLSMEEQKIAIENALDEYRQNEKQRDDITLLGLKF